MPGQLEREKVAILGGGPAAMASAFELTATPELRDRFELTVYQPGWRLGGKCASGRKQDHSARIEEHGLHLWFGFYDNAFSIMRAAYDELDRPAGHPLATLEDAFKGCDELVLFDRQGDGWHAFAMTWLRNDLKPGERDPLPDLWEIAALTCDWAVARLRNLTSERPEAFGPGPRRARLTPGWFLDVGRALGLFAGADVDQGGEHLLHLARHLASAKVALRDSRLGGPRRRPARGWTWPGRFSALEVLAKLLTTFRDWVWEHVVRERHQADPHLRLFFTIFDTFASATAGIIADGVLEHGWEAINDRELCEWLTAHGAKQVTVGATPEQRSPLLRSIYDVAFGYPGGAISQANVAAGTAMNDLLRLAFSYRGSLFYKMQAGMGDTVLTPLYEVLKRRGVKFKFFHAVTQLELSADGELIEAIDVVPQVELKDGEYDPLVPIRGLECWPSEPLWDKLRDGESARVRASDFELETNPLGREPVTLHRGQDFDAVVLGISVAALPPICGAIAERHERFARMLASAQTVRTQAFQLWLAKSTPQLGWQHSTNSACGCYVEPLDTWCDMSQLIERESWPEAERVGAIAYFCGVLDDREGEDQAAATARVHDNARAFLEGDVGALWPRAVVGGPDGALDWTLLVDRDGRQGPARFDAQYWWASVAPSERYVLTPAGSVADRLGADESGVANLVLAGDWTRNGIDGGCVEAAMTSGMQAARALIGHEREFVGESPTWLSDRASAPRRTLQRMPKTPAASAPRSSPAGAGRVPTATGSGARQATPGQPPLYVEYGGRATAPPPFLSRQGRFRGFVLEGDRSRIDALCARTFNAPAAGAVEYQPLGHHLLMLTGSFAHVCSLAPGFEQWGFVEETQISLWVPVAAGHRKGETFVADRLCMAVPYIFVDNPMSYAGGREDYGYPKSMGRFSPDTGVGERVQVETFGGNFAADNQAGWHRVLELERLSGNGVLAAAKSVTEATWHAVEEPAEHLLHPGSHDGAPAVRPDIAFFGDFLDSLLHKRTRQLFLKQFRDVETDGRACYQAVVESPIHVTQARWRPSLHEWKLTVHPLDSHPIGDELGVKTQTTRLSYELEMDMIVEGGVIVAPAAAAARSG